MCFCLDSREGERKRSKKERIKERKRRDREKKYFFFSLSLLFLEAEGERSLLPLSPSLFPSPFDFPPAPPFLRTWNVASSLTNAGSPLRLPSTSFSDSRCATCPERSRWALDRALSAQTRPEARCLASRTVPNEPVPVFFFFFFFPFFILPRFFSYGFLSGKRERKKRVGNVYRSVNERRRSSPRTTPRSKEASEEPWRLNGGGGGRGGGGRAAEDDDATTATPFPPAFTATPSLGEPNAVAGTAASEAEDEVEGGGASPGVAAPAAAAAAAAFAASLAAAASAFLFFARCRAEARRGMGREMEGERKQGVVGY